MIEIDIIKRINTYKGWVDLNIRTTFKANCITLISGPSGAGKTTLLRMIAGLINPDQGTIRYDGSVWFDASVPFSKKIQERGVGFVFQDYALFPNMTVEEQLNYGTNEQEYISRLLSIGELEPFRKKLPRQLSGGQQQRLAILRALSTRPRLLLMDESLSALDLKTRSTMLAKLKQLFSEQQTTVLMVSHDERDIDETSSVFFLED